MVGGYVPISIFLTCYIPNTTSIYVKELLAISAFQKESSNIEFLLLLLFFTWKGPILCQNIDYFLLHFV